MSTRKLESLPFFNEAQVAEVLHWLPLIDAMEQAMTSFSAGRVEQPVRQMVPVPGHDAITPDGFDRDTGKKLIRGPHPRLSPKR